jgi:hypothetical protein
MRKAHDVYSTNGHSPCCYRLRDHRCEWQHIHVNREFARIVDRNRTQIGDANIFNMDSPQRSFEAPGFVAAIVGCNSAHEPATTMPPIICGVYHGET